jgi:hypothetical protein
VEESKRGKYTNSIDSEKHFSSFSKNKIWFLKIFLTIPPTADPDGPGGLRILGTKRGGF